MFDMIIYVDYILVLLYTFALCYYEVGVLDRGDFVFRGYE